MNSRLIRLLIVVIGIAIGLSATYLFNNIDNDIDAQRSSSDVLREQAATSWQPSPTCAPARSRTSPVVKVRRSGCRASRASCRHFSSTPSSSAAALTSPAAQSAFEPAAAALANIRTLDTKVREFVQGGSSLLAADMIFSDGLESIATASTQVTVALSEEIRHRNGSVADLRSRQLAMLGGGAGVILLLMVGLALSGAEAGQSAEPEVDAVPTIEPIRFEAPLPKARAAVTPKLLSTAQLCRELARVGESRHLPGLLERAARVIDASGIIVWVAEPSRQRLVAAMCARLRAIEWSPGWEASTAMRTMRPLQPIARPKSARSRGTPRQAARLSFRCSPARDASECCLQK